MIPKDGSLLLHRHLKRKTFLPDPDEDEDEEERIVGPMMGGGSCRSSSGRVAMWDADHGTGAFYIIMDAVRQKIARRKKEERDREMRNKEDAAMAAAMAEGAAAMAEEAAAVAAADGGMTQ